MQEVSVHDKDFVPFISAAEIRSRVKAMGEQLTEEYRGKKPLLICVLNGAFIFAADLIRELNTEVEIQFVRISSYGSGMSSTGKVRKLLNMEAPVEGRDIILVEDIVDTGNTLDWLRDYFRDQNAKSVSMACLLFKKEAFVKEVEPEHFCFEIPNRFVVGYGLDYAEFGRRLPDIYVLKEDS